MDFKRYIINEKSGAYLDRICHTAFPEQMPRVVKRPTVIVCPGGGYCALSAREADPVAYQFLAAEFNTFVLYYSLNEHAVFPNSLLDLCAAMKLIRENAEEFGVIEDQIAVLGFSAGGHLTGSLGVHWNNPEIMERSGCKNGENKPNALVMIYPVVSTSWMENHDRLNMLIGDRDRESTYKMLNLHTNVTKDTPPAFLCHTVRDGGVPCDDSIKFASAMIEAGVPCELHLFPNGQHGLALGTDATVPSYCTGDASIAQWPNLAIHWLKRLFSNPEEGYAPIEKAKYSSKL
jgi:acetyl esterase/lipase